MTAPLGLARAPPVLCVLSYAVYSETSTAKNGCATRRITQKSGATKARAGAGLKSGLYKGKTLSRAGCQLESWRYISAEKERAGDSNTEAQRSQSKDGGDRMKVYAVPRGDNFAMVFMG